MLTGIITAAGLRAIDAGGLKRARELEALGFLQITLAAAEKISWTGCFAVAPWPLGALCSPLGRHTAALERSTA